MKKVLFIVSIAANLVLIVLIFTHYRQPTVAPLSPEPKKKAFWRKPRLTRHSVVTVTNVFAKPLAWDEIESADYVTYVKNLRAAGCPESTVRDIIVADVEDNFLQARDEIVADPVKRFWEIVCDNEAMEKMVSTKADELGELHEKKETVLHQLLGTDYERKHFFEKFNPVFARLGFLPPEKRERILDLHEKFSAKWIPPSESLTNGTAGAIVQQVNHAFSEELAKLLTPAELEEYELQVSPRARRIRRRLEAFEPTELEFKQMFALQNAAEEELKCSRYSPNEFPGETEIAIQKKMASQLSSFLSLERREDLKRSETQEFRRLYAFTQRLQLPRATTIRLHDITQQIARMAKEIEADATLTTPQRNEQLAKIREAQAAEIVELIGEPNYESFKENAF